MTTCRTFTLQTLPPKAFAWSPDAGQILPAEASCVPTAPFHAVSKPAVHPALTSHFSVSPQGLDDKAWRTKQGSVQLLGAMAYCAPKQLSSCLPTVVPKLSEVLTDTHPKVQAAAQSALQEVGSVIKNPEIAALVPTILVAVADPNEHTRTALEVLLQVSYAFLVFKQSLRR
jgi:hypothetical protein